MRLARTFGLAAGLAMMGSMAVPGVAQAAPPVEHLRVDDTRTGSAANCGFTIDFVITDSAHVMLREVKGSDGQAFVQHVNYQIEAMLTNPETGAWMRVHGHSLIKDLTARHVEGNIWEFTAHEAGQPFVIEDSEGKIVARNRGLVTTRYLFDTLGDSEPSGNLVGEIEVTGVFGPHPMGPLAGIGDPEFCAIATDLIG
jgi:hypothetical protein